MKKKLLLLITSVVMLLSLAGCSSKDDEAPFEYKESMMALLTTNLINQYKDIGDDAVDYYLTEGSELEASFAKGFSQLQTTDKVGDFVTIVGGGEASSATFENGTSNDVLCTIRCQYENRDVDVKVSYVKNKEYFKEKEKYKTMLELNLENQLNGLTIDEYIYQQTGVATLDEYLDQYLTSNEQIYPFTPVQAEVSAVYSKTELLKKAGANTAIGMVTVFLVLIFISFIISLLKFVPMLFDPDKKAKKAAVENEKTTPAPKPAAPAPAPAPAPVVAEDVSSDDELVAVITAALYAMLSEEKKPNAISKDKLIVRSIRRVK